MNTKHYSWDEEKNKKLIRERDICFEDIVEAIASDGLLEILLNPNAERYPDQNIYVVQTGGYVYLVPYRETEKTIHLITIIPSRKARRRHFPGGNIHEN
jgi:uncharacterized DUF497 family protein